MDVCSLVICTVVDTIFDSKLNTLLEMSLTYLLSIYEEILTK